jgi:hypothetical protein
MIQRVQTIWLLLAALCNAGVFYFEQYRANVTSAGAATTQYLKVSDHFPSLLIALVITIMPLAAIFMFGNRKRQRTMTLMSMVLTIGFISMTLMRVSNFNNGTSAPVNGSYWIGSVLPVVAIVFLILALRGIRKDEKLVKSVDRLR